MGKQLSLRDLRHLRVIRDSVDILYRDAINEAERQASMRSGVRILDVAPQDDRGISRRNGTLPNVQALTLDIAHENKPDIVADLCDVESLAGVSPFDIVICAEVLEHVRNPFSAAKSLLHLLRPGGTLFASSPFDFRIHGPLPDNWRFTEHGWRQLLAEFEDVRIQPVESRRFLMPIHYRAQATRPTGI